MQVDMLTVSPPFLIVNRAGIGLGITEHLLSNGAKVVVGDLNTVQGTKVVDELKKKCGSTSGLSFCV